MSSPPVDVPLQGSGAPAISPQVGEHNVFVIDPQVAGTMRVVCFQLLHILDNVSNAARDSAISEIYPQLDFVRVACCQLLHILGPSCNSSSAALPWENQVSMIYPQITLTATQLKFVWDTYFRLLKVYDSLDDGSNTTQFGGRQILRDSAIAHIYQVTLIATHLEIVLFSCYQLLQVCGMLPVGYNATRLEEHQVLTDNVSQIQPAAPETAQLTDAQATVPTVPTSGDTSDRLPCPYEGCKTTFGRPQECKRHFIDIHTSRRQCLFPSCSYDWSRPDKIKTHLTMKHRAELPQEVLDGIRAKRGQRLVAYLGTLIV